MFQKSDLTQKLCDFLRTINGTVEYAAIVAHIGQPIEQFRGALSAARKALERDEKIVFATEYKVGLRRLTDQEKVWSTNQFRQAINRKARKGIRRVDTVTDLHALPLADQTTAIINRTIFAAVDGHTRAANKPPVQTPVPLPLPDLERLSAKKA